MGLAFSIRHAGTSLQPAALSRRKPPFSAQAREEREAGILLEYLKDNIKLFTVCPSVWLVSGPCVADRDRQAGLHPTV